MSTSILIVEDEAPIRRMLSRFLTRNGFAVLEAASAEAAFSIFMDNKPDLVITDQFLPDYDGIELVRRLRTYSSNTRFILMSGMLPEDKSHQPLFNAYIDKPIMRMSDMLQIVKSALQPDPAAS